MPESAHDSLTLHASCVALDAARGLLITGASGRGKSTLALSLMAFGARLVSDDMTSLTPATRGEGLMASLPKNAPEELHGTIEARGLGLLQAEPLSAAQLRAVVDLDRDETERLPPHREILLAGHTLPVFHRVDGPGFAPALIQWLKGGRLA